MLIGCLCVFMRAFWKGTSKPAQRRAEKEFWRENQCRDDPKLIATTLAPNTGHRFASNFRHFPRRLWFCSTRYDRHHVSHFLFQIWILGLIFCLSWPKAARSDGARGIHWNILSDNSKPARSCQLSLLVWSDSNQQQTIQFQGFSRMFFFRCQLFSCTAKSATWRTASLSQSILSTPAPCIT